MAAVLNNDCVDHKTYLKKNKDKFNYYTIDIIYETDEDKQKKLLKENNSKYVNRCLVIRYYIIIIIIFLLLSYILHILTNMHANNYT